MTIRFSPELDKTSLASELANRRRVQIRNVLQSQSAARVHDILQSRTPWWLAYNEGDSVAQVSPEQLAALTPAQMGRILTGIAQRARSQYQFVYRFFPVISSYFAQPRPNVPIFEVFEFLNSPHSLDFFRELTGQADIQWVDAQPTLYRPGDFLKSHSDLDPANARVAAYVLNFTPVWERDWGGYLQFFNASHDMIEALRPIFNGMNIFMVPIDHSVGIVAPFATAPRLSVTGWFRRDAPPGKIGI
ncbi:SM-20-related protein [Sphingomonas sp. F9_3S_D5_B_2]